MKLEEFLATYPPFQVIFWADGMALGEVKFREEPFGQTMSEYFICPECQDVWGLIEYPNRHWLPQYVCCRQHRDTRSCYHVPGSMLYMIEDLDNYPEALVRREFEVHLQHYEKGVQYGTD